MWRPEQVCLTLLAFFTAAGATETEDSAPADIGRIRGGFDVRTPFSWLGVFNDTIVCGAVLVHSDIVLTTATCVDDFGFPFAVRLGSLEIDNGGTVAQIKRGLIHPEYTGDPAEGADIAILQLESLLTNTVAIMNEDPQVPFDGDDDLFMAGWGLVNDTAPPAVLQGVFLENVENCFARAPPAYNPVYHLCGNATPASGTCPGDAGIPVLIPGTRVVVGLNSFSDRPCEMQTIDVYTRMSSYSSWVKKMICEMSEDPPATCSEYEKDICLFDEIFKWVSGILGF